MLRRLERRGRHFLVFPSEVGEALGVIVEVADRQTAGPEHERLGQRLIALLYRRRDGGVDAQNASISDCIFARIDAARPPPAILPRSAMSCWIWSACCSKAGRLAPPSST